MMNQHLASPSLSILIPTYGRDQVLIDTIAALLELPPPAANELIVLDQTPHHPKECEEQLARWHDSQEIRWVRLPSPSITVAMNLGLVMATSDHVLFVDDDVIPDPELLAEHRACARDYPRSLVAGRVLQPWHHGQADPDGSVFRFNSLTERDHDEFIGCNVSMDRQTALEIGGFDRNFVRVAYRYEAEFSYRWKRAGHPIRYNPKALVHHLKVPAGGTRSFGEHLTTVRPDHAVGRYYYFWRTCSPILAIHHSFCSFFRSIITRHHVSNPWWIPLTLFAELRGFLWSCRLALAGPSLQAAPPARLLIITSHPIQYQVPLFRQLADDPSIDVEVLYLTLPNAKDQGEGFGVAFEWDTPLLSGYRWRKVGSLEGAGGFSRFSALRVGRPFAELKSAALGRPDMVFITGWHCLGLLQLFMAAWLAKIPILLRMENNDKRKRGLFQQFVHRFIVSRARFVLPVGAANSRYYHHLGISSARMVASPYCVDNSHFSSLADRERPHRQQARLQWSIPEQAFCFLFCGKLQEKKHPEDILDALQLLKKRNFLAPVHCLFVGTGALEQQLRRKASSLNLPATFAGFLNQGELPSAYVASDALVLPSDNLETWGLVVNEAMACGLPAIVSDQVGCSDDLILPGQTGYVYPFGDLQALSLLMESMASDPGSASRMGIRAASLVDQHYSLSKAAQGIRQASLFTFSGSAV